MKHKALKISLIIIFSLAFLLVVLALSISPIAKNYIEKHSKELIGRKILMQNLHLNIFTGTLELDSIRMYEQNDKDIFAAMDTFRINLTLHKLFASKVELSEVRIIHPYAQIIQNKDKFNFDDLMPKKKKQETSKSSFPKSIILQNILIRGGNLVYTDRQLNNTIRMNDLGVAIPELCFEGGNTKAGINLKIGDASLKSHTTFDMKTNAYTLTLQIARLPLSTFSPYAKQNLNIDKLEGLLNSDLQISGNMNHLMDFLVSGTVSGNQLNITNSLKEPVAAAGSVTAKISQLRFTSSSYLLDYLHASGVDLNFILRKDGNNFTSVMKTGLTSPGSGSSGSQPITCKIKDMNIEHSQVTFTDKTLEQTCVLPMKNVTFQCSGFDLNATNEFNINASFPKGGKAQFKWKGNFSDVSNQQIFLKIQNMSLTLFSPYCLHYMAYDLTDGNFNFTSRNSIVNNNINSANLLDAYKASAGKKYKELKPEYHVPLKLALYVLKDKDNKISLDLPVKGNIKDPKFSYSKIIFKTIVNLMVKIAVSPFRFLAGALGMNADKMEAVEINPLQTDFTAEQYRQLNDIASIVKKKPEMMLTLTQFIDMKDAISQYGLYRAKESYLLDKYKGENRQHIAYTEITQIKDSDPQFGQFLNALVTAKDATKNNASLQDKIALLYPADSLRAGLTRILDGRNVALKNYMITSYEVPVQSIVVQSADKASMDAYSDKHKYKVDMHLPGEENAQAEAQATEK